MLLIKAGIHLKRVAKLLVRNKSNENENKQKEGKSYEPGEFEVINQKNSYPTVKILF